MPIEIENRGRFTPVDREDFGQRARSLSRLLGSPYQKTQEALARLYGYSGLHEMHRAVDSIADVPDDAGPYDSEAWAGVIGRGPGRITTTQTSARSNATLQFAAELAGTTTREGGCVVWDSRDLGLFDEPERHRRQSSRILGKQDVLRQAADPSAAITDHALADYAAMGGTSADEAIVHFTALGAAVKDAVDELSNPDHEGHYGRETAYNRLMNLQRIHPENPWVHTALVVNYAHNVGQGPWDTYTSSGWIVHGDGSAPEEMIDMARRAGTMVIDDARRAIALFERLYAGHETRAKAPENLVGVASDHGTDSEGYASVLYWGGMSASNLGIVVEAVQWLKRSLSFSDRSDVRARLAMMAMAAGSRGASRLVAGLDALVPTMVRLDEALAADDREATVRHLTTAALDTPWLVDVCEGPLPHDPDARRGRAKRWGGNAGIRAMLPDENRVTLEEYVFRVGHDRPTAAALRTILADAALRTAYRGYWKAVGGARGVSWPPPAHHEEKLRAAVRAAVKGE